MAKQTTHPDYPDVIYVTLLDKAGDEFDASSTWEDAEDSDQVAVYKLDYIAVVREKREKSLVALGDDHANT